MKKIFFVLSLFVISVFAKSQGLYKCNVFSRNNTIEFSIHSGTTGRKQNVELNVIGFGLSVYGIYADYVFWSRSNNIITSSELGEDKTESFHIGYQFPITKWLKITPLFGYADVENMGRYYYSFNPYNNINRILIPKKRDHGFDFGVQVVLNLYSNENVIFMLQGTYTKYCEYCGFGVGIKI